MFKKQSDEVFELIEKENERQRFNIELIASENYVSKDILKAAGSILTNKYAEGYPGRRYYGGCENVDEIESLAIERAKKLFGAEHANVQPHSGSQANMAAYMSVLDIGDTILASNMDAGGHLTHSSPVSFVSKLYNVKTYGVNYDGWYDYGQIRETAKRVRPKLIVAGASAYPRTIDFKTFREIADEVGAYLMVDMAHIAGLVAGGVHESPVPYADIVTSTCHKTLRGIRGGFILCKKELAKKVDSAVFPRTQGGPLEHIIAAKAVCFKEAMSDSFKRYAKKVIENNFMLATELKSRGIDLVTGGTSNHLTLIDLSKFNVSGWQIEYELGKINITVNKNMIPDDPRPANETSGIRIGTAAVTTRGFGTYAMCVIGNIIADVIYGNYNKEKYADTVSQIASMYKLPTDRTFKARY